MFGMVFFLGGGGFDLLFLSEIFLVLDTMTFSFLFNKYYPIMELTKFKIFISQFTDKLCN